jgi:signal transduction histidine kinase
MEMAEAAKILLIDDSEDDRMFFRRSLQGIADTGYDVVEASTGEEGLSRTNCEVFACVLLDYSLPGRNGVEILKQIRFTHPFVPVVMLTGLGNEAVAVSAMQEGAQNYLVKGAVTSHTLEHVVNGAMQHCEMQKRITEQREALEIFSRALAHDLKEPMRTMRSMLDVIQEEVKLPDEMITCFQSVQNCATRMTALIDSVRAYTQLGGPQRSVCDDCDVNQLVEVAIENIGQLVRERAAVIKFEPLPRIYVNRTQVIQIFQNLLSNAIRHCEITPQIDITAIETGKFWQFHVSDNGPGVSGEESEKLFKPFTRFSRQDTQGLGLGLAICKKLMDMHGGRIWCEPPSGGGATFVLSFPKDVVYL